MKQEKSKKHESTTGLFSLTRKLLTPSPSASSLERNSHTKLNKSKKMSSGTTSPVLLSTRNTRKITANNTNPFMQSPVHKSTSHTQFPASVSRRSTSTSIFNERQGIPNRSTSNIVYNPYGLNNTPSSSQVSTSSDKDIGFYMQDGESKVRTLPLPISDPNEFLPDSMKQYSVHLSDNFVFDKEAQSLGSGGSCDVKKIRSSYKSKDIYALKKLNIIYDETPEKFYKRCSKEFIIAKSLSHNIHIANTFYLLKIPTTTSSTRGWGFVMEICQCDLFQLVSRTGWRNVPMSEKHCIFKQIAHGVKFCHDNGIAHRDLKPENVLMSKDGVCKLTDFGISDWYHTDPADFTSPVKQCQGMIGSPPYAPPEVMCHDAKKDYPDKMKKPYNPLGLDTYALGLIFFVLMNGTLPFLDSCDTDARFRSYEVAYTNFVTHQSKQFRRRGVYRPGPGTEFALARNFRNTDASRVAWRLADPVAETRYTMDDLFEDPWFAQVQTCVAPDEECEQHWPEMRHSTSDETNAGYVLNDLKFSGDTVGGGGESNGNAATTVGATAGTTAGSSAASSHTASSQHSSVRGRHVQHNHMNVSNSVTSQAANRSFSER